LKILKTIDLTNKVHKNAVGAWERVYVGWNLPELIDEFVDWKNLANKFAISEADVESR